MGYDILVRQASANRQFADALVKALEGRNLRCRLELAGIADPAGTSAEALQGAPLLLLILAASDSDVQAIRTELTAASQHGCEVWPLCLDQGASEAARELVADGRRLDLDGLKTEEAVDKVVQAVSQHDHHFGPASAPALPLLESKPFSLSSLLFSRRPLKQRLIAALLLLLLLGGLGLYARLHEQPVASAESQGAPAVESVLPFPGAFLYVYTGAEDLSVRTLRLDTREETHLVQVKGGEFGDQVYRAFGENSGGSVHLKTLVDGREADLFNVIMGSAALYRPGTRETFPLVFSEQHSDSATLQEFIDACLAPGGSR